MMNDEISTSVRWAVRTGDGIREWPNDRDARMYVSEYGGELMVREVRTIASEWVVASAVTLPLPEYDITEMREDLHHLLQPIIGEWRIEDKDRPTPHLKWLIDRLRLALGLVDMAAGKPSGYDVRMGRTKHGCGFFREETTIARALIQIQHDRNKEEA